MRDEYRMEYDEGRGGFGALVKTSAKAQEEEKEGAAEEGGAEKMQEEAEEGGAEEESTCSTFCLFATCIDNTFSKETANAKRRRR